MKDDFKLSTESKFIIFTAVLASLLEIIDTSIVNVAIPTMMGNLGATLEDISWVVTGYIIANAIVLPASSWLGSQIGRRRYYITCILLFTLTSVACGLAPNLLTLTIFRVFQGLAGGALLPTSQALIQEQFPREKAGMASAIYGMSVMIGPTIGPTLGGVLTDHLGWRSIFNINLPLGLLAAFFALRFVKNHAPETTAPAAATLSGPVTPPRKKIDAIGLILLSIGIGCLQFVLERGQADAWFESTNIVISTILAVTVIPTFIWWELKVPNPIINLRLFKVVAVRSGTILMSALGFMLYGLVFILPIFVTRMLHFSATQTGELFIPGALLTAFCMPNVGNLLQKIEARALILFGITCIVTMLFMLATFGAQTGEAQIFNALLVRGLAMAFLFVPINAVVLSQFKGIELGQVAGLMNLFRQLGGSIGIALISTLLERNNRQNLYDLVEKVSLLNPATQLTISRMQAGLHTKFTNAMGLTNISVAKINSATLKMLQARVETQMFVMSFTQMVWILLITFAMAIIPLYFLKAPPKKKA